MTTTTEHLEHAEHAKHAAHDPFDRRVAMTMAIVAAVLACETLASHREHTNSVLYAAQASDQWNYYQAKKNREYLNETTGSLLPLIALDVSNPDARTQAAALREDLLTKAQRYEKETDVIQENARQLQERSELAHHRADHFDTGELGVELALVLCSIAVLTKRYAYWFFGMGFGVVGIILGLTGLLIR
jgi:Domain of unknown function (DUF4337)